MAIENTKPEASIVSQSSEHLLSGIFTPHEKNFGVSNEDLSLQELLAKNEQLLLDVHAQAGRLAVAAVNTLAGLPSEYQQRFFDGVSCFNDKHDIVWNSVRAQWSGGDTQQV